MEFFTWWEIQKSVKDFLLTSVEIDHGKMYLKFMQQIKYLVFVMQESFILGTLFFMQPDNLFVVLIPVAH